ncbi:MAG TPA: hypothetical protein GXZ87_03120 [Bacteroidales bacterium]|nr:hypothetical protein [Bacteroidales bacterium]
MKKIFLIIFCLVSFLGFTAKAQDTIVVKDGSYIISKIMEIHPNKIIYTNFLDLSGAEFSVAKEEVDWVYFRSGIRLAQAAIFKNDSSATEPIYINDMEIGTETIDAETVEDDQFLEEDELEIDFTKHMSYAEKRRLFPPSTYVRQPGDPYQPALAGVASYFLPGLGQIVSGETLRGLAFMGGELLAYSTFISGVITVTSNTIRYDEPMPYGSTSYPNRQYNQFWQNTGQAMIITGIVGMIGIHIWNIVDAVQVAKVNNMYFQAQRKQQFDLSLRPFLGVDGFSQFTPNKYAGVTLSLSF